MNPRRKHRESSCHQRRRPQERQDPDLYQCLICKKYHPLKHCRKFLNMDTRRRRRLVENYKYCVNCLARSHTIKSCTSLKTCKRCDALHHTLLHMNKQRSRQQPVPKAQRHHKKKLSSTQRTSPTAPNTKILSEAIRSLANVLCASDKSQSVA